jgi:hypothetical protein
MLFDCGGTGVIGELFHTPAGAAFADVAVNGRREAWPIRSSRFRAWLRRCHYEASGTALDAAAIRSTLDLLEARALFDAPGIAYLALIGDKAFDAHWLRERLAGKGIEAVIPPTSGVI